MKRVTLILIMVALAVVSAVTLVGRKERPPSPPASSAEDTHDRHLLYLFYDQVDQDPECRRIYALVNRAERELAEKVEVRRVDVDREMNLVQQFQVRVRPAVLLVSPTGAVEARFEGDDDSTAARIELALNRLKETLR